MKFALIAYRKMLNDELSIATRISCHILLTFHYLNLFLIGTRNATKIYPVFIVKKFVLQSAFYRHRKPQSSIYLNELNTRNV